MRQAILRGALIVLAAAAAFAFLFVTILSVMLRTKSARVETFVTWGGVAVIVIAIAGLLAVARRTPRMGRPWTLTAVVIAAIAAAGAAPMLVDHVLLSVEEAQAQAERDQAARLLRDEIVSRAEDVTARIAAHRPYTPDEAFGLVWLVGRAASSGEGGPKAMDLLRRALDAGLIDPNGRLTRGAPTVVGQPLYVGVHTLFIAAQPGASVRTFESADWEILKLLVAHGADLSLPGGAAVAADLGRKPVLDGNGRFMHLE